jgi:NAD(P)-dependent dehydrogenase (short-subunit alcohol dehydrogenase family)
MDLTGQRIVVTGAAGALGQAVSSRAAELGAQVLEVDVEFAEASANRHAVDLTDEAATAALVASLAPIDGLLNIAGGFAMGGMSWEADDADWERMFRLNVATLRSALKAAVPLMLERGHGRIVNVGAYGALSGLPSMSAYTASKSVVMRLTESLADEVRERGINVNAVLPTVIDTPANRAAMPDADPGRWVAPRDLANAICFLASDAARAIHGALLPVRGLS